LLERRAQRLHLRRSDVRLRYGADHHGDRAIPGDGFVTNVLDNCSVNATLALSAFTENLGAGDTCALDSRAPGTSGIGCAAAVAPPLTFAEPPETGDFKLKLAAPGPGNTGSVIIGATVDPWLRFDWDTAAAGEENPQGQATFGLYSGEPRQIYLREVY
jgi:MSHA biogenesis protein MshQ